MAVDLTTATPLGTDPSNSTPLYQIEWGYLIGEEIPDGVLGDTTGNGWQVYAAGSSTDVVVKPNGASLSVRGVLGRHGADITLDVAAYGVAPGSGVIRRDLVVARCNYTTRKVQIDLLPGTPGAGDPVLTRNPTGVWEIPLARITRNGNTAVTQAMVERLVPWVGRPWSQLADLSDDLDDAPMGSTATIGFDLFERAPEARNSTGNATGVGWWKRTNPPFTSSGWSYATGMKTDAAENAPKFRLHGGRIEAIGHIERTTSADFTTAPTHLGVIPAAIAGNLSLTRYGQASTNAASGCRLYAAPQSGGHAWLYALCPTGTSVIILDGWSVASV